MPVNFRQHGSDVRCRALPPLALAQSSITHTHNARTERTLPCRWRAQNDGARDRQFWAACSSSTDRHFGSAHRWSSRIALRVRASRDGEQALDSSHHP